MRECVGVHIYGIALDQGKKRASSVQVHQGLRNSSMTRVSSYSSSSD